MKLKINLIVAFFLVLFFLFSCSKNITTTPLSIEQGRIKKIEKQKKILAEFLEKQKLSSKLDPEETLVKEAYEFYKKAEQSAECPKDFHILGTANLKGIEFLEKAIAISPYYHAAYYALGLCYSNVENYNKAEECFLKSIKYKPKHQDGYTNLANIYKKQNRLDEALNFYDKSLKAGLPTGLIFSNIGEIYLKKGDLEKAETFYLKILNFDKGKEYYSDDIASFYLKKGNLKESWKYLKESFIFWFNDEDLEEKIEPYKQYLSEDNFYAHVSVGYIYYSSNIKYKEAIEHFEKALKLNKSEFDQYCRLGMSYIKIIKYKKAIIYLEEALERNPNHYDTNLRLGIIYGGSHVFNDYKRSIELLEKAKQINPENRDPYFYLGNTYLNMKKYPDALRETRKALDIEKDESTLIQMGYIYNEIQDHKMALEYYNQALELFDNFYTRQWIIETLIKLKDYDKAKDFINESIDANPNYADFKIKLCDVYFEEGEYLSAITLYEDYLKKEDPNNSHAHFYIALSYLRLKNWDESEFWWKKYIDIDPKEPSAFYNLGLVYSFTAKYDKAIKNFSKYLKFNPNSDAAKSMIESCQYQIDLEKLPEKLRELSRRKGDIGNIGKLLTCLIEYCEAHDLFIVGDKETTPEYEMIGYKKILTSYNVSSKIYESQGHFEKIVSDLNRITSSNKEINEAIRLFVFATEQRIAGIEEFSKGYYVKAKDYKGEFAKGRAKIKVANTYFVDSLKIIRDEVIRNKSVFDKIILERIDLYIKHFSSN